MCDKEDKSFGSGMNMAISQIFSLLMKIVFGFWVFYSNKFKQKLFVYLGAQSLVLRGPELVRISL